MERVDPAAKLHAPAAERNRQPLLDVLRGVLPQRGTVLEVASGTGQHAVHFARALKGLTWQPSDVTDESLASIAAYAADERLPNLKAPLKLDATASAWPEVPGVVAILCVNMIHIAPWDACEGLVRHAGRLLRAGGALILYGPFMRDGVETAPSNLAFDASLKGRDPRWGVRKLEDVARAAEASGLTLGKVVAMPANNLTVVLYKS